MVLCAQLPLGDPRLPAVEALTLALGMWTFDDSAIFLDACLRDAQDVGIGDQLSGVPLTVDEVVKRRSGWTAGLGS